jgi:hypothetical protein
MSVPPLLIGREACCVAESIWKLWIIYKSLVPAQTRTEFRLASSLISVLNEVSLRSFTVVTINFVLEGAVKMSSRINSDRDVMGHINFRSVLIM